MDCELENPDTLEIANEVHHTHKLSTGGEDTFLDVSTWAALCKRHHSIRTKKGE